MTVQQLSLDTLGEISDGAIRSDFNSLLARLIEDCTSRPAVKKARTLTIKCELVPRVGEDGHCSEVDFSAQVLGRSPARVTVSPAMQARKSQRGPMLVFDKDGQSRMPFED